MTPIHASKKGVRYRYYVSKTLITPRSADAPKSDLEPDSGASAPVASNRDGQRLPAAGIGRLVLDRMLQFLATPSEVLTIGASDIDPTAQPNQTFDAVGQSALLEAAQCQASSLSAADVATQRSFLLGNGSKCIAIGLRFGSTGQGCCSD